MMEDDGSGEDIDFPSRFPPNTPPEGRFIMWHAAGYYDESDDIDRGYAVAGFVGHQHDCVHFDFSWQEKILDKYGIEFFKASQLSSGKGQFAKFRDDPNNLDALFSPREKQLFDEIKIATIDVILEFQFIGVGAVLMLPDYHRIFEEYQAMGKTVPAPYFLCSQLVMMETGFIMHRINQTLRGQQKGIVRPCFDWHEEYSGRAKQSFDDFAKKNPVSSQYLLPPHYEGEKKYLMLQAADNLAYESRRLLITEEYDTHIPERRAMKRLKEKIYKIYKLNYRSLKALMEAQSPDSIPFEADIHNSHELVRELNKIERGQ